MTVAGGEHGIRLSQRGHRIALWCACQRRDKPRAPWLAVPVEVRARWTVPEALSALKDWHERQAAR